MIYAPKDAVYIPTKNQECILIFKEEAILDQILKESFGIHVINTKTVKKMLNDTGLSYSYDTRWWLPTWNSMMKTGILYVGGI